MGVIRVLPPPLVDRIAAGEVIERPQSVVKELVENALDAGATHVRIEVEEGGRRRIRVIDDGRGMDRDDLALAWLSHSTSKLADEEDLFRIRTLGFRGEALASIGSVAQARMVSRPAGTDEAAEVENHGGRIGPVRAAAGPLGTMIEVDQLFFNVPVRKKFLRSPAIELARIVDTVTAYALARLDVRFELHHEGAPVHVVPPTASFADRVRVFHGDALAADLIHARGEQAGATLEAWLAPPSRTSTHGGMQHFFLNGRHVRDKVLYRAVGEAYRDLLPPPKRYPIAFLFLTLAPEDVDVNVHPTKLEVRFRNPWRIQDLVERTLRPALERSPRFEIQPRGSIGHFVDGSPDARHRVMEREMLDFFSRPIPAEAPSGAGPAPDPLGVVASWPGPVGTAVATAPAAANARADTDPFAAAAPPVHQAFGSVPAPELLALPGCLGPGHRFAQLHDSYIIEEEPGGIVLIDQHALHERILSYEIRAQLERREVMSQQLLIPAVLELPPRLRLRLEGALETFRTIGFRLEPFGRGAWAVHAIPCFLGDRDPARYLTEVLEEMTDRSEREVLGDRLTEMVDMMACKAAIKAGQRLPAEEIRNLLALRHRYAHTLTCPHGRPTTLRLSLAELERHFHRK